ncbi:hypothetical protein ACFO1B_21055 [Dactylosporangium siamense]|uniref:hypothetical protein n=1 Tax=Dactylosporangium siamense TaxID=685454 RepID=UPI001944512C|nr:hypothetical protein [Dactylosporangium siamense]
MNIKRAVVLLALLLAGCGDPIKQSDATPWTPPTATPSGPLWTGKVDVTRETGALAAPGFNALIDAEKPNWAQSPDGTVTELLNLGRGFDGPVDIYLLREGADGKNPVLTVTLTKLGDDSIRAIRYRIALRRGDDGRFRFVEGKRTQRCQNGRGHQDFSTDICS